jgi:hypothetical protein
VLDLPKTSPRSRTGALIVFWALKAGPRFLVWPYWLCSSMTAARLGSRMRSFMRRRFHCRQRRLLPHQRVQRIPAGERQVPSSHARTLIDASPLDPAADVAGALCDFADRRSLRVISWPEVPQYFQEFALILRRTFPRHAPHHIPDHILPIPVPGPGHRSKSSRNKARAMTREARARSLARLGNRNGRQHRFLGHAQGAVVISSRSARPHTKASRAGGPRLG